MYNVHGGNTHTTHTARDWPLPAHIRHVHLPLQALHASVALKIMSMGDRRLELVYQVDQKNAEYSPAIN